MKTKLRWGLIALSLLAYTSAFAIEDSFDRFTSERKLSVTFSEKGNLRKPIFNIKGVMGGKADMFIVQLVTVAANWQYLQCHDVKWLVNGVPFPMPAVDHNGMVQGGRYVSVIEFENQLITPEQIALLGAATSVEYRVCNDEFSLSPSEIAEIGELSRRIQQATTAPPKLQTPR